MPPKELFLIEENYGWISDSVGDGRYELPKEGVLYFPKGVDIPFNGFPFPIATHAISMFKRLLITKIREIAHNPFQLLFIKSHIRELDEVAKAGIDPLRFKPERYCRACREIYRLLKLSVNDLWAHRITMIFQWDSAYRGRMQNIGYRIVKEFLIKNPSREIERVLRITIESEDNKRVKSKLLMLKIFVPILIPFLKKAIHEFDPKEFLFDKSDIHYLLVVEAKK